MLTIIFTIHVVSFGDVGWVIVLRVLRVFQCCIKTGCGYSLESTWRDDSNGSP